MRSRNNHGKKGKQVENKLRHAKVDCASLREGILAMWHVLFQHVLSMASKLTKQGNVDI